MNLERLKQLSPKAQRRAIARDVLKQLDAKKYRAKRGVYVYAEGANGAKTLADLRSKVKQCDVCAIGSIMMSVVPEERIIVDSWDECQPVETYPEEDTWAVVEEFFPNAREMEDCFEKGGMGNFEGACHYRESIPGPATDANALRCIMANVVRNGEFIPEDTRGPRAVKPYKASRG